MPKIGLSRPYVALYNHNGAGTVTYTKGIRAGRAVSWSLSVESTSNEPFRADNEDAESANGVFSSGNLTLEVAELDQEVSSMILGTRIEQETFQGEKISVENFDDDMTPPELGYGIIEKRMRRGIVSWRPVLLPKIKFNIPEDTAKTQGTTIEWQTDTIAAKVMRDDTIKHRWQRNTVFDTESKADAWLCHVLGIKDATLDTLTITSAAGSTAGTTTITVTPELTKGRTYRYKTGADFTLPELYADLSTWNTWDGVSDIPAATGNVIAIAEVDGAGLAMAAGITTVAAKEE